jgi:hypothetical protein
LNDIQLPEATEHVSRRKELDRPVRPTRDRRILPTKGEVYPWLFMPHGGLGVSTQSGFVEAVIGACERVALLCWDSKLYLLKEARRLFDASGELLWWRDDTHINGMGYQAIASFVGQEI